MTVAARHIRGDGREVTAPVPASVAIDPGDLMFQDVNGNAYPASSLTAGSKEDMQRAFAASFLGSSADQRRADQDEAGSIRVKTAGVHKYPCDALANDHYIGEFVAVDSEGMTAGEGADQWVEVMGSADRAIGKLCRKHLAGETFLEFELFSAVMCPTFVELEV